MKTSRIEKWISTNKLKTRPTTLKSYINEFKRELEIRLDQGEYMFKVLGNSANFVSSVTVWKIVEILEWLLMPFILWFLNTASAVGGAGLEWNFLVPGCY